MNKLKSPIRLIGGKGNMVAKLLKLIPPHHTYVEPFGGAAQLLFAKPPSKVEIYNDIDGDLVNLFGVIRDPEKFKKFHFLVSLTPYSRQELNEAGDIYNSETYKEMDDIYRAYIFFIQIRMSFSGLGADYGWSFSVKHTYKGIASAVSNWLSIIELLPEIHKRLIIVQIEHKDFREIFKIYDTPETLFYCDPPYILQSVKNQKLYKFVMSEKDHEDLVDILLNIQGMAILSGYKNKIYERLESSGWKRVDFKTASYAAGRTRLIKIQGEGSALEKVPRIESVWINPHCQQKLERQMALIEFLGDENDLQREMA